MNFNELFGSIYIINLSSRVDRWLECEAELFKNDISIASVNRFVAIPNLLHGIIGCGYSHASALMKYLSESDEPYCLILEDDFQFKEPINDLTIGLNDFFLSQREWNVLLLCGNEMVTLSSNSNSYLNVLSSQTASAYVVKRNFAPKLIERLLFGTEKLRNYLPIIPRQQWVHLLKLYASDMVWKDLQKEGGWFVLNPIPIIQRPSYSDIMKQMVDYGV